MPAYDEDSDSLATKIATVYPDNKKESIPTIQTVILLYDASHGTLKAILYAEIITDMRTAAASMVATKHLAPKNAQHISILGAGSQARSHYQVLKNFVDIKKVSVWNVNKESGEKLAEEIRASGIQCEYYSSVEYAVKDADIINVVTMATQPILMKKWIKEGAHINAVGAPFPDWQELEEDLMHSSVVYVDSYEGAKKESGDIIKSGAEIYAEIGEVVSGTKKAYPEKTTIFKSLGMAVEDVVAAEFVYKIYSQLQTIF
nr:ketimine reductase mu-crystallin isoform X2 [Parasteatoda tepidariorum]